MKVIIDTDPGQDDAMALMLLLKSPRIDVAAITTVAGNSTIENTTRNAAYILRLLGRKDIPLYSGAAKPLERKLIQAVVHGESGLDGVDLKNTEDALTNNAAEKIVDTVKQSSEPVTLLTLGPLTNIARAIMRDPVTMKRVHQIVIMGGAFEVAGNKNRVAEFNMFVDPEAASIVLDLPVKKVFVPLDACNHIQLKLTDFEQINDSSLRKALIAMNRPYIESLKKDMASEGALMYDVLAAYYLLEPKKCSTQEINIELETKGDYTRGMTIIDKRPVPDSKKPNAERVTSIPEEAFKSRFITTLNDRQLA